MMRRLSSACGLSLCLTIALAGCGPEQQVVGAPPAESNGLQPVGPSDPCGAGRLKGLVGQPAADANIAALPAGSRILYPDQTTGPAFVQDRITVKVNSSNVITSVQCG